MAAMINCPYCGKLTDPKLESCPHCGGYMQRGGGIEPPRPGAGRGSHQTCPNCRALVKDGDIICVACGTNLLTGEKIAEERKQQVAAASRVSFGWIAGGALAAILVAAAIAYLVIALTADPIKKAVQLGKAGKYLEASNALNGYLEKHPDDAKAELVMGKLQWNLTQYGKAADCFEKAANADAKNVDAGMLAVVALAQGSGNEATRDRQITILRQVLRNSPDNAEANYLLALELGAKKDAAGEVEALKKVIAGGNADPTVHKCLGIALALQGDKDGAEQELNKVTEKDADLTAALGFVDSMAGKFDEAEQQLKAAIDAGTSIKNAALTRLGVLLVSEGKFGPAEQYLSQAIAEDKNNRTAAFFHALCLQTEGKNQGALREFETLANSQGAYAANASVHAADLTLAQGDAKHAGELVESAIAGGASSPALYTLRGRIFASANADDKAREAFKKALDLDATYAPAHLESGLLYVKQQYFKEGLQELEKYLELMGPDSPGAHIEDVQALVTQLKQASGREKAPQGATPPETEKPQKRARRNIS